MSEALRTFLEPIAPYLGQEGVSEVSINRPGEAWIEVRGDMERVEVPAYNIETLMQLGRLVAQATEQVISEENPLLSATLPEGHRVQVVFPPACEVGSVAFSIRKPSTLQYDLDTYEKLGAFAETKTEVYRDPTREKLRALFQARTFGRFLRTAVRERKNIIVSGGTSTGKTTFLNAMLREISASERIITVEDAREVVLPQPNRLHLLASRGGQGRAKVTPQQLIEACLRLRPDRIIMGELRGAEAFSFLRAINTGHPGSIATLHADTPDMAFEQLVLMVTQADLGLERQQILDYCRSIVEIIVQLKRGAHGRRYVSEIYYRGAEA
jgi:type IV secretion system protein VirB11